ncbi:MAG: response regulator [Nitrospira sp.]|nr:response regulator [Nitrospira sp.]
MTNSTRTRTVPLLAREGKTWRRLVDDEALIRSLLRRILEKDGHQIREADNGQIGLTLYREAPADVVITDILMPERDGMDVTLALTREFRDARVIAITGATGNRHFLNMAKLVGARHVIQKPFTPDAIRRAVRLTLDH